MSRPAQGAPGANGSDGADGADGAAYRTDSGFENRADCEVSYVVGTRTLTIQPKAPATEYVVWTEGVRRTKSGAESVIHAPTEGLHWFWFDSSGVLQTATSFPGVERALAYYLIYDADAGR